MVVAQCLTGADWSRAHAWPFAQDRAAPHQNSERDPGEAPVNWLPFTAGAGNGNPNMKIACDSGPNS